MPPGSNSCLLLLRPPQLMYDITNSASFSNMPYWLQQIKEHNSKPENMTILVVGNKCDLQAERAVEEATAQVRTYLL